MAKISVAIEMDERTWLAASNADERAEQDRTISADHEGKLLAPERTGDRFGDIESERAYCVAL